VELGAGTGRDARFFSGHGSRVRGVEIALEPHEAARSSDAREGRSWEITPGDALAYLDALPGRSVDAVYSNMFFNMDFDEIEHWALFAAVQRCLRPRGLHLYSVRATSDPWFGRGRRLGPDRYEMEPGGITLHFFSRPYADRLGRVGFAPVRRAEVDEGEAEFPIRLLYVIDRATADPGRSPRLGGLGRSAR